MGRAVEIAIEGGRFDHVAHAATTIRELLPLYAGQLGGRPLYGGENERVGYRGMMLGFGDGSQIELLEPLPGSTFLDRFFARNPAGGLHHVTFRVDDLRRAVERARAAGLEIVGEYLDDPDWLEAFVHPRAAHGTVVQLLETAPDRPAKMPGVTFDDLLGPVVA